MKGIESFESLVPAEQEQEKLQDWIENGRYNLGAFSEHILVDFEDAGESDEDLKQLIDDMFEQCRRYTATVIEFEYLMTSGIDDERYDEISAQRGNTHDATIDAINAVRRLMQEKYFDTEWADEHNLHTPKQNRVHYAKFAMLLTLKKILMNQAETQ